MVLVRRRGAPRHSLVASGALEPRRGSFARNEIKRQEPNLRAIDLSDFDDAALGPGGAFISRWGADRSAELHRLSLCSCGPGPSATTPRAGYLTRATYVEEAWMPLPPDKAAEEGTVQDHAFMSVALLTYAPRSTLTKRLGTSILHSIPAPWLNPLYGWAWSDIRSMLLSACRSPRLSSNGPRLCPPHADGEHHEAGRRKN